MNTKIKVLLAEDEPSLGQIIKESLESRNFEVLLAEDGVKALELYHHNNPSILVLDVMMPLKDGFTLAKEIRQFNRQIPIIFLTAKSQTKDVLEGFKNGGNDYIKKPFSMEELIVRMESLLRMEFVNSSTDTVHIGHYKFNPIKQTLYFKDETITLTHRESELLLVLSQKKNETANRTHILKKLWGTDDFFSSRSMDVFITKLRKKLNHDKSIQIVNVRGFGYKLIC